MNPDLCIGIMAKNNLFEVAALKPGKAAITMTFPATGMGVEAIGQFLSGHNPVRLAVAGAAALSLALALGKAPGRETFIVSSAVADQAVALVRYAERAV